MASGSVKKERLREKILNHTNAFMRQLSDSRLTFVSITKVDLSPDNAYAILHWDTFDSSKREAAEEAIESAKGKLRTHLAKALQMRQVPEIRLKYDNQFEAEQHINDLLKGEDSNE